MNELVVSIQARLYGVPAIYIGDADTVLAHCTDFFKSAALFLNFLLPRDENVDPTQWASWTPLEKALLTEMVSLAFLDRLSSVTIPAAASQASSTVEVQVAPTIVTKGKADEVEATFATANMVQKQAAGTMVLNISKLLETIKKSTEDKIVAYGIHFRLDLNQYVGRKFFDWKNYIPYKD